MTLWKLKDEEEKIILLQNVAEKEGVLEQSIEKDWYVSATLKALKATDWGKEGRFLFKGGTSLSKGWKLINRFSEDIDLAIRRSFFPAEDGTPRVLDSPKQRTRLRRYIYHKIEEELFPDLRKQLDSLGMSDCEIKMETTNSSDMAVVVNINYISILPDAQPYMPDKVKMEFSAMSLDDPFEDIPLNSLINEHFSDVDEELCIEFPTVVPARTFLEKIFLLHEKLQRKDDVTRNSRHLYDLVRMMDTPHGIEAILSTGLYRTIVRHRANFNKMSGVDYNTHHPSTVDCCPGEDVIHLWEEDYNIMKESNLYGNKLSFKEVISAIEELKERLSKIDIGPEPLIPEQPAHEQPKK